MIVICTIIDDKEDEKRSLLNHLRMAFQKKKKEDPIKESITNENEDISLSQTTVLSTVEVDGNNKIFSALQNDEKNEEDDEPRIIEII